MMPAEKKLVRRNVRWAALAMLLAATRAATLHAAPTPEFVTSQTGPHGADMPMDLDPPVTGVKRLLAYDPRLKELWLKAMDHGEAGLKMQACEAFAVGRQGGMPDIDDLPPRFAALVKDDKQPSAVRAAAAGALAVFEAKDHADALIDWSRGGKLDRVLVADPALARWKAAAATDVWIARVKDPATPDQVLQSAMRSLGDVAATAASEPLRNVLNSSSRDISTRLVAATALARLGPDAVKPVIDRFATASSSEQRFLAASMAPADKDPQVVGVLVKLSEDAEPSVVAASVEKLLKAAPASLKDSGARLADNKDAVVRRLSVDVLRYHASAPNVAVLARLLADEDPYVRVAAREKLIECDALPNLRDPVRANAMQALKSDKSFANEQAAYVLAAVQHKEARDRLVELLNAQDRLVRIASVVALRRLAIPDTLDPQFNRAKVIVEQLKTKAISASPSGSDTELSELLQNFGAARFKTAEDFMKPFIPKGAPFGVRSRSAAIWSLGLLHEGAPDKGLASAFDSRLQDTNPLAPEAAPVRYMSAVSLGRMKASSHIDSLRRYGKDEATLQVGEGCRWAAAQIENKPYEPSPPVTDFISGWFLEPI